MAFAELVCKIQELGTDTNANPHKDITAAAKAGLGS